MVSYTGTRSRMSSKARMRSRAAAYSQVKMKIRANMAVLASQAQKYNMKLPWPNLDADGGEEYEFGNKREDESDPKLFSMDQYEHTDSRDDADVAEDEPFQDDSLN